MKKFTSILLCLLLMFSLSVFAFADNEISVTYTEKYDKNKNTVTVTVNISNAEGLSSGYIGLLFDPDNYEFVKDSYKQLANSNVISEGGKTVDNDNECACAFMATTEISASDCNTDGSLDLCTYQFKVTGAYSANSFYVGGSDFYKDDTEVAVKSAGNVYNASNGSNTAQTTKSSGKEPYKSDDEIEAEENIDTVDGADYVVNEIGSEETSSVLYAETDSSSSHIWLIIVIVVAVAAVATIAVIITKKKSDAKITENSEEKEQ